jgi:dTDP-4-dehydrorhamnose reductase
MVGALAATRVWRRASWHAQEDRGDIRRLTDMIVLVIGHQGQLARSLDELVPPAGVQLVARGRPSLDLQQRESIVANLDQVGPDLVINAAAYTAVDKAESEPDIAFAVNAEGPGHLAQACAERDIPVIHISTDYVYDGTKASAYVETDPVNPINAYGRSKLAGEQRLAEANPRHIILRTAWVHSPFGTNIVKTMLRLGATRPEINVVNDQHGNPTYAPHLAQAILEVGLQMAGAGADDPRWGVYHAVATGDTTWYGVAREIFAHAGNGQRLTAILKPIATAGYPTPAKRPANSRLDTSKLSRTFGVILPSWTDGIAACIRRIAETNNDAL